MRIDLPGDEPAKVTDQLEAERAEVAYATQAVGVSATDAAVVASALAEQLTEE